MLLELGRIDEQRLAADADGARAIRARMQAVRDSGLALPPPDYERVEVAALLRRDPRS